MQHMEHNPSNWTPEVSWKDAAKLRVAVYGFAVVALGCWLGLGELLQIIAQGGN